MHASVGILSFPDPETDQKNKFGGSIGCGETYLEFLIHHFKVFSLHAIVHSVAEPVQLHDWTRTKFMFTWSRDWTFLLPLRKTLSAFQFQLHRPLKEYDSHF